MLPCFVGVITSIDWFDLNGKVVCTRRIKDKIYGLLDLEITDSLLDHSWVFCRPPPLNLNRIESLTYVVCISRPVVGDVLPVHTYLK